MNSPQSIKSGNLSQTSIYFLAVISFINIAISCFLIFAGQSAGWLALFISLLMLSFLWKQVQIEQDKKQDIQQLYKIWGQSIGEASQALVPMISI